MDVRGKKPLPCRIRQVVNALTQEQAVPASGRLACATLQIENLPEECDLNSLEGYIDGVRGTNSYIGPRVWGLSQFNVFLPPGVRRGLVPVRVEWHGRQLCPDATVRVIPPGPLAPRLTKLSDGVNLLSQRIESGWLIATVEDVDSIDDFRATVDGVPVPEIEPHKTDPLALRYEVNFQLPAGIAPGSHVIEIHLGKTMLTRTGIEVSPMTRSVAQALMPAVSTLKSRLVRAGTRVSTLQPEVCATLLFALASTLAAAPTESQLRTALLAKTGAVTLPGGTIEISREIILPSDAHDLDIRGNMTHPQSRRHIPGTRPARRPRRQEHQNPRPLARRQPRRRGPPHWPAAVPKPCSRASCPTTAFWPKASPISKSGR